MGQRHYRQKVADMCEQVSALAVTVVALDVSPVVAQVDGVAVTPP